MRGLAVGRGLMRFGVAAQVNGVVDSSSRPHPVTIRLDLLAAAVVVVVESIVHILPRLDCVVSQSFGLIVASVSVVFPLLVVILVVPRPILHDADLAIVVIPVGNLVAM